MKNHSGWGVVHFAIPFVVVTVVVVDVVMTRR
jgi:hypothetical protein